MLENRSKRVSENYTRYFSFIFLEYSKIQGVPKGIERFVLFRIGKMDNLGKKISYHLSQ